MSEISVTVDTSDLSSVRRSKLGWLSSSTAALLLIASLVDISWTTHYIIYSCVNNRLDLPIEATILIFVNMWFINNIRLKASVFLFGHMESDNSVVGIAGNILSAMGEKMSNGSRPK